MDTMIFEARAVQRHLRKSPRKVRLIANAVRRERVDKAFKKLEFMKKGAAIDVSKVIRSAVANLRDKFEDERFDEEMLFIKTITVDEGITLKRIRPRAMGRANRINKRSCHITVVVEKRSKEEIVTE